MKSIPTDRITKSWEEIGKAIEEGKVVVAPTDTIIGILGNALNKETVEKIYRIKKRKPTKPYIILIPDVSFLSFFGIKPKEIEKILLEEKGITVVLRLPEDKRDRFFYLHRGANSLAFRIPGKKELLDTLKKIKLPVVAPSANPEGKKTATSAEEAFKYFGKDIDLYFLVNESEKNEPSTILKVENEGIEVIREGNIPVKEIRRILKEKLKKYNKIIENVKKV